MRPLDFTSDTHAKHLAEHLTSAFNRLLEMARAEPNVYLRRQINREASAAYIVASAIENALEPLTDDEHEREVH